MYRISVGITTGMHMSAIKWIRDNVEKLGADGIWIGEDIEKGHETTILVADMLSRTARINIGTGIIPIAIHNISTIARAGLTLQEIGSGRFNLGIGIGGIQDLQKLGIHIEKPVSALRNAIHSLRRLFSGETVTIHTELSRLKSFSLNLHRPIQIPIVLGVRGPQMLELAGEIADGVILSGPFEYIRNAIQSVNQAARKAKRKESSVKKIVWLPTIPTFKGGGQNLAKRVVALVVADTPLQVLEMLDVDDARAELIRTAVATSGPSAGVEFVNQEFIDTFAISGTKDQMVEKFESLYRLGSGEVVLGPPFSGDWRAAMTEIIEEILTRRG